MITVDAALNTVLALVKPLNSVDVPLALAAGRCLAEPVLAQRNQPPFAASAMDGYAIATQQAAPGDRFTVIGESAAGHGFSGTISPGQTVRIFTGAPVPKGGKRIIIQEDVARSGDVITLGDPLNSKLYIRAAGADFAFGHRLAAPRLLTSTDIALIASMNCPNVTVRRKPIIAVMATGDELVMPGEAPGPDQIIASNSFGLKAMFEAAGADVRLLPIAKDTRSSLRMAFELAQDADLIVTIGGASVGDHDLVADVTTDLGMERSFYKVAMRPGKPLMAGRLGTAAMIGLPGNPVSSMVCGEVFVIPMIRRMLGLPAAARLRHTAPLAVDMGPNGAREHYMRAKLQNGQITPFNRQDSALLTVLAEANILLVRSASDPAQKIGDLAQYILL